MTRSSNYWEFIATYEDDPEIIRFALRMKKQAKKLEEKGYALKQKKEKR